MDLKITYYGKPAYGQMFKHKAGKAATKAAKQFCFFIEKNHWPNAEELTNY